MKLFTLLLALALAATACAHDVVTRFPSDPRQPSGSLQVVLNQAAASVSVVVAGALVAEDRRTAKVRVDGVPVGRVPVRVAIGGRCEEPHVEDLEVDVVAGGLATIALPGSTTELGCSVRVGLAVLGVDVLYAALMLALL